MEQLANSLVETSDQDRPIVFAIEQGSEVDGELRVLAQEERYIARGPDQLPDTPWLRRIGLRTAVLEHYDFVACCGQILAHTLLQPLAGDGHGSSMVKAPVESLHRRPLGRGNEVGDRCQEIVHVVDDRHMPVRLQEGELRGGDVALAPDVGERVRALLPFHLHRAVGDLIAADHATAEQRVQKRLDADFTDKRARIKREHACWPCVAGVNVWALSEKHPRDGSAARPLCEAIKGRKFRARQLRGGAMRRV
jgi:hypothetical protein